MIAPNTMQNHTTAIKKNRFRTIGWPWLMFRTGSARLQARQPEVGSCKCRAYGIDSRRWAGSFHN